MVTFPKAYFSEFWNYIDITRIAIIYGYSIMKLMKISEINDIVAKGGTPPETETSELIIFTILNFIVWMRFIANLRIFDTTRGLIRLVTETMKDMLAFAIVLVLGMMAILNCYHVLRF